MSNQSRYLVLLLAAAVSGLSISCGGSPSEPFAPTAQRGALEIVPGLLSTTTPNTLTVEASACGCTTSDITVSANGTTLGTLGCGDLRTFDVSTESGRLSVTFQSPGVTPTSIL